MWKDLRFTWDLPPYVAVRTMSLFCYEALRSLFIAFIRCCFSHPEHSFTIKSTDRKNKQKWYCTIVSNEIFFVHSYKSGLVIFEWHSKGYKYITNGRRGIHGVSIPLYTSISDNIFTNLLIIINVEDIKLQIYLITMCMP